MGDTTGLYLSYESAIEQFNQRNFLMAAVEAYWCLQYCYYGEPYGIKDLHCYESTADTIFQESKKMLGKPILSKSQYINGCQCLKHLWLHRNKYKEREVPKETQKKYDVGHLIGKLAQNLFPNGKDATPHQCYCERVIDMSKYNLPTILKQLLMIENTKLMIDENVIYEASFLFNATYASVDILVKESDKRIAYEVKSSTEISETFINDCAFQYYVISNNIRIDDFFLVYLNEEYIKKTNIPLQDLTMSNCDVNKLFIKESVLDRVIALQAAVSENVNKFKSILSGTEPIIKQGDHCHVPYECAFNDYCYKLKSNKFKWQETKSRVACLDRLLATLLGLVQSLCAYRMLWHVIRKD